MTCVEAFGGAVAAVKPQSAFFEQHGSAGIAVLERALAALREAGTLASSTPSAATSARRWRPTPRPTSADEAPLRGGRHHPEPLPGLRVAAPRHRPAVGTGRGVFVLALTSNPEGRLGAARRRCRTAPSAGGMVHGVREDNRRAARHRQLGQRRHGGRCHRGPGGAAPRARPRRRQWPAAAPGIGAQGGTADDLAAGVRRRTAQRPGHEQPRDPRRRPRRQAPCGSRPCAPPGACARSSDSPSRAARPAGCRGRRGAGGAACRPRVGSSHQRRG